MRGFHIFNLPCCIEKQCAFADTAELPTTCARRFLTETRPRTLKYRPILRQVRPNNSQRTRLRFFFFPEAPPSPYLFKERTYLWHCELLRAGDMVYTL